MKSITMHTKYSPPVTKGVSFQGVVGLTDQQFKDDCNIETVIKRYGVVPRPSVQPIGGDVSQFKDYQTMLDIVREADSAFASQPSDIRARFGNSARLFYDFVTNPANAKECVKIGLMKERKVEKPVTEILEEIRDGVTASAARTPTE